MIQTAVRRQSSACSERAEMLGGTLVAEPTDGGWRVTAELPLEPPA